MAEFQWWLLLVGLVAGGGLVAVVFLDGARREQDLDEAELPAEATWIAARLGPGRGLRPADVEAVLREHREYRLLPPPDRLEPVTASSEDGIVDAPGPVQSAPVPAHASEVHRSGARVPGTPPEAPGRDEA